MTTSGDNPTAGMKFRWPWRPYQQRVLGEVERHLGDRRLHIVAAPGSGKTTLGLELFRRLARPAVVMSPTLTIRNQWLTRLGDFLGSNNVAAPAWASVDLDTPGFLTSITYQALHTKYRTPTDDEDADSPDALESAPSATELSEVADRLRAHGIGTLILDEAHHLRQEWWKALDRVVQRLDGVTVISLTATPPYDAVGVQWQRYEELCGPIDEEISVPELVRAGTLCPHQDYVFAVRAGADEASAVRTYDETLAALFKDLLADEAFAAAVAAHPWIAGEPDAGEVLDAPELAVALLAYLWRVGRPLPAALLTLLDYEQFHVPPLERRWWQVLVEHYLFDAAWPDADRAEHRDALARRLRGDGLLYRRELRLLASRPVQATLSLSPEKIDAVVAIHRLEADTRRENLRQVVLTDFIRDEGLARGQAERRLGTWPIFTALADAMGHEDRPALAMLTGRQVVLHRARIEGLKRLAGCDGRKVATAPLPGLDGFERVTSPSGSRLVGAMTQLLAAGDVRVLVGTRSLLGEGWDAPPVNSLILASYVGSFMLTNQMRGRAIRKDPARPGKAASIWHLLAIAPESDSGRADWEDLQRRFNCFVGLHTHQPAVLSGLERMDLPAIERPEDVAAFNEAMRGRFAGVFDTGKRWAVAIEQADDGRVRPQVQMPRTTELAARAAAVPVLARRVRLARWWTALATAGFVLAVVVLAAGWLNPLLAGAVAGIGAGGLFAAWAIWRRRAAAARLHMDPLKLLAGLAAALRDAMCSATLLDSPPASLDVSAWQDDQGAFAAGLAGGSFHEQALFADCLGELLGPVQNPRYLLIRHGEGLFAAGRQVHAVPQLLGINRDRAEALQRAFARHLAETDLLYTRTDEGRAQLLKVRGQSLFAEADAPRRRDRWQ